MRSLLFAPILGLAQLVPAATGQSLTFDPAQIVASAGRRVELGQLGPDADVDCVVGAGATVKILHGNGAGGLQLVATVSNGLPGIFDMELGDVNNDPWPDVVNGGIGNGSVMLGDGQGGLGTPAQIPTGSEAYWDMELADFDLDGETDLVHATDIFDITHMSLGTPTNFGSGPDFFGTGSRPEVVTTDLDSNGEPDFVVTNSSETRVYLNFASSLQTIIVPSPGGVSATAAGDVTGSGKPDIVIGSGTTLRVFAGNGNGNLAHLQDFATPSEPSHLEVADLNGDGHADVVATARSLSQIAVHLGDGQGGLAPAVTLPSALLPDHFALGDLNADGLLDIVAVGSNLAIHLNRSYPAIGTSYCTTNANSTGGAAAISALGSRIVSVNYLQLAALGLPAGKFGYFVMADAQDFVPLFGTSSGNLCLALPLVRFSSDVQLSSPAGAMDFQPDLANLPQSTVFLPGETWNFQCWFRDDPPASNSNTTDGLAITFQTSGAPSAQFPVTLGEVEEEAVQLTVAITLSQPAEQDVAVHYVHGGTATNMVDYRIESPNPIVIPAGATMADLLVTIAEDPAPESDETVEIDLTQAVGGVLGSALRHTLTIRNDD